MVANLIKTINTYNVNVVLDNPIECAQRFLNNQFLIYFTPVEGDERYKYEKSQDKKFISTTPAIHIPNLSMREFVNTFECDGSGIFDVTKEMISPFLSDKIPFDTVFTTFLFLHEVGHWMQFEKVNRNVSQYINIDKDLNKKMFDKFSTLTKQQDEYKRNDTSYNSTTEIKALLHQFTLEYRNLPKEKDADQFAINNMHSALKLIMQG